jgi:hypothetical protein
MSKEDKEWDKMQPVGKEYGSEKKEWSLTSTLNDGNIQPV